MNEGQIEFHHLPTISMQAASNASNSTTNTTSTAYDKRYSCISSNLTANASLLQKQQQDAMLSTNNLCTPLCYITEDNISYSSKYIPTRYLPTQVAYPIKFSVLSMLNESEDV
ncbi:unnamed protein product [Heterobilharzia americana]|nr:unnamed protein product [Heterobilharzia americana]